MVKMLTKKQCNEILEYRNSRDYSLKHGEYARPESKVRKLTGQNAYGITTKYNYYVGSFNAPKDGFEDERELIYEYCMLKQAQRY